MTRVLAWVSVIALGAALSGCAWMIGGLIGDPPLRAIHVEAARADGAVVIVADDDFEGVGCDVVDLERWRRLAPDVRHPIWSARCPAAGCGRRVRYGDRDLDATVPVRPLSPSPAAECYCCYVGGRGGRGEAFFTIAADGTIGACATPVLPRD
jgi:hypothetical protein